MVARKNEFDEIMLPSENYTNAKAMSDFPEVIPEFLETGSNGECGLILQKVKEGKAR